MVILNLNIISRDLSAGSKVLFVSFSHASQVIANELYVIDWICYNLM